MKKLSLFFTLIAAAFFLPACNDSDGDLPSKWAFATVVPLTNNDYFFRLDDDKTLYPSDKSRIGSYAAKEGQRAVVYFNFLDPKVEGYDYNVALYDIADILTKEIKTATTQEELDEIGDDALSLDWARIGGGYLTLEFSILAWPGSKHEMNLIVNEVHSPGETLEGYTDLEFRQKADNTQTGAGRYSYNNFVSFRLGDLDPAISGSKGFYIRIRNLNGNIEYKKIDISKEN